MAAHYARQPYQGALRALPTYAAMRERGRECGRQVCLQALLLLNAAHAPQHPHPSHARESGHQLLAMPTFRHQLGPGAALPVQADGL